LILVFVVVRQKIPATENPCPVFYDLSKFCFAELAASFESILWPGDDVVVTRHGKFMEASEK
jgi:hypothetical protein